MYVVQEIAIGLAVNVAACVAVWAYFKWRDRRLK
jgi:hypothetical protein